MKRATFVEMISLFFVILFLYTGISKWMDFDISIEQLGLSPILAPIAEGIVIILPIIEFITAILLFIPRTRKIGLFASLALMVTFTGYIVYLLNFNNELPCTCGGVLQQMSWPQHLIFNVVCIILAISALRLSRAKSEVIKEDNYSLIKGSHI